ncbi:Uncharacterized protein APZ42_012680 [Daphnia magna]|uniref:Uncharacterized protein n=1 Tax=Daphnia magna TaxID=35525 RepID=A0A0N8EEE9_9CRUS|nr:Uncharacterized protein APZ42_012680 [Daphnia magna]
MIVFGGTERKKRKKTGFENLTSIVEKVNPMRNESRTPCDFYWFHTCQQTEDSWPIIDYLILESSRLQRDNHTRQNYKQNVAIIIMTTRHQINTCGCWERYYVDNGGKGRLSDER